MPSFFDIVFLLKYPTLRETFFCFYLFIQLTAFTLFYLIFYLFIWLHQVLVAAGRILSCGMRTLSCSMYVGSGSLSRNQTPGPLHWEHRVLYTAPPGKSHCFHSFHVKDAFSTVIKGICFTKSATFKDQSFSRKWWGELINPKVLLNIPLILLKRAKLTVLSWKGWVEHEWISSNLLDILKS